MNVAWYARRLARMSPAEMAGRTRDAAVHHAWRRRQVRDSAQDPRDVDLGQGNAGSSPRPLDTGPDGHGHPRRVPDVPDAARTRLLAAADELLAGRWPVFALVRDDMSPAPDWFLDPRTGLHAPSETYCFDIDHRREDVVGNVKYVWETSRHQHCTVLAAAWYLTGDDSYAEAAATHLRSWWAANPFLSGIHWTSGIELGVRLVSWVWVRRLLDDWPGVRALFEDDPVFRRQLHDHQEHLAALPSRGSSANNHLLAEAAGQFVAACAFGGFAESDRWRARAAATLQRELPRQTFPDGLNRELATAYHGFVLELGLAAAVEGEASGHPLGDEVWDVLRRMTDAVAATVDVRLHPPRQGDDDGGLGLLVDGPGYDRWASLLTTGARLFGAQAWWPDVPGDDVRTPLLARLVEVSTADGRVGTVTGSGSRPATRPSLFPDAGMALLRDEAGRPDEIWCRVDGGPHGYLAIAAHAHADALSVVVRVGGVEVLVDPGTYCYHGDPALRAYTRSTIGHNTLEVGGQDQSVGGGPFLWTRHAQATLEATTGLDAGPVAECRGRHEGYRRLSPPAVHRRDVRLDRVARRVEVTDLLDTAGEHEVRLAYHLGPDVDCVLDGNVARLSWTLAPDETDGVEHGPRRPRGGATLALPDDLTWSCLRGSTDPVAGWYSPAFDVIFPAVTLIGSGRIGGGRALRTALVVDTPVATPATTRPATTTADDLAGTAVSPVPTAHDLGSAP